MNKKLIALLLAGMMMAAPVSAAESGAEAAAVPEWGEGKGPAHPYTGVPEVDLDKTMGYVMLYPRVKMPAEHFCDILEMYLPREDVVLGDGKLTLYDKDGEVFSTSFADADYVKIRDISTEELTGLMWGGGVCIDVYLPVSLRLNDEYYVQMEKGCFSASDGKVVSLPIETKDAWQPLVTGDFGISSLAYTVGNRNSADAGTISAAEAAAAVETGTESGASEAAASVEYTRQPKTGDRIRFDLTLGGDAASAIVFSDNGSVYFDPVEFTESCTVTGYVMQDDVSWGIEFVNKDGDILDILDMSKLD